MMARALKPRARRVTTFRIDESGAGSAEPAWMVRFIGANMRFVDPSLDFALAMALEWCIATAVLPGSEAST
ncbi:hypothetical protein DX980_20125 [Burkholderia gladioli]|uniref:hypothetical protein n=1 Tax=Burkholderia gladioli TaxID=28095 RepID=UPI001364E051|nr:hypothetical protein [Burkholderia gladioli]KAF1065264.1 hypothetical protein LvStA_03939 [Burkholderia gladioli]WAG21354.1 hypothetical protein DX980_20125 [Burkholderia gladioli]